MIHKKPLLIYLLAAVTYLTPSQATELPLHKAVKEGNLEKCRQIIQSASPQERIRLVNEKESIYTPLCRAADGGFLDICKLLCEAGADPEPDLPFPPLFEAIIRDDLHICKYLIEEQKIDCNKSFCHGMLLAPTFTDNKAILQLLLDNGYDLNKTSFLKQNSLHTNIKNLETYKWLIKNGINVNQQDYSGQTPLFKHAQQGNLEICELLIENGADTSIRDNNRNTFLTNADESIRPRLQTLAREQRRNQNRKILFFTLKLIAIVLAITTLAIITTLIASKKMAKKKKTQPSAYHKSDETITLYKSHRSPRKPSLKKEPTPQVVKVRG